MSPIVSIPSTVVKKQSPTLRKGPFASVVGDADTAIACSGLSKAEGLTFLGLHNIDVKPPCRPKPSSGSVYLSHSPLQAGRSRVGFNDLLRRHGMAALRPQHHVLLNQST
jgi:hypothetical protein